MSASKPCPFCGEILPASALGDSREEPECTRCGVSVGSWPDPGKGGEDSKPGTVSEAPTISDPDPSGQARRTEPGSRPLDRPTLFGDYEVLEKIASGGMGVVYKARQVSLNRIVALKMILRQRVSDQRSIDRFFLEAQAAAKLHHPNIVAIHEVGEADGDHFFTMDYVAGQTLDELIREHPLSSTKAAAYMEKVGEAIHYAHTQGVLHRDLKPGNVILDENDEPQVTDFGIAKLLDSEQQQTMDGTVLGTPSYMSPEQARGLHQRLDARSDLYSLGAVLYTLVSGRPPFRAETTLSTLQLVMETDPVPPRKLNPRISADVETICLKCLNKAPQNRYPSVKEFAEDLRHFLNGEPIQARPAGPFERGWRWCKRKPALAAVGGIATLLLAVVSVGSPMAAYHLNRSKNLAEARELTARRNAYAADMSAVQSAIDQSKYGYALQLLERHRPSPGMADIRNWEWRHFWQQCQSDDLATLTRHERDIYEAIASHTGEWIASWGGDSMVKIWSLKEDREVYRLHNGGAPPPRFSIDDKYLAIPTHSGAIKLLDLQTLEESSPPLQLPYEVQSKEFQAIGFHSDGRHMFSYAKGVIRRWDISSRREVGQWTAQMGDTLGFSPDWESIVFTDQRTLFLWSEIKGLRWTGETGHDPSGSQSINFAFSPDGRTLAVSVATGSGRGWGIQIWNVATGKRTTEFPAHAAEVTELAFSSDGKLLGSTSYDQTTQIWDTRNWQQTTVLKGHNSAVFGLSFLPGGEQLVTSGRDGTVRLWATQPGGDGEQRLELDKALTGQLISERRGTAAPDGSLLVMIQPDGAGILVDSLRLEIVRQFALPFRDTFRVAMGTPGPVIACARAGGLITFWLPGSGQVGELQMPGGDEIRNMAFSPDGRWFAALGQDSFRFMKMPEGTEVEIWRDRVREGADVRVIRFSPDGRILAWGHEDGSVSLWDVDTAGKIADLIGHEKRVLAMAFSLEGTLLGTTCYDEPARVWDMKTHAEIARFSGSTSSYFRIGFSPDGSRLFLSEWDNGRIMDIETKREVARLKSYYPMFLNDNTVLGLSQYQLWHWHPPSFVEIDAQSGPR